VITLRLRQLDKEENKNGKGMKKERNRGPLRKLLQGNFKVLLLLAEFRSEIN
jgi:hypothetical protein